MQINVSQLLKEPIGATRDYVVDEEAEIIGDGKIYGVRGDCHLMRTNRSILATCSLHAEVELTCCRCLCSFRYPLEIKFEEEFLPTIDILSGMPLPPPDELSAFTIDERHILDLAEAIRQYAVLAVPMKVLCADDCAGLCPTCGENLNLGPCGCPTPHIDPRWSALKGLL